MRAADRGVGFPSNRGGLLIDGCILSLVDVLCVVVSPPSGIDVAVEHWFSCCLVLSGSVGEDLFVDNRRLHLTARMPALVVVAVDESSDFAAGLSLGRERPT